MIHNKYYKLSYHSHIVTEIVFCHICPRIKYRITKYCITKYRIYIYMNYEARLYIVRLKIYLYTYIVCYGLDSMILLTDRSC